MWFGRMPTRDAEGTILAHALPTADGVIRKGVRLGRDEIARLEAAGHAEILVARLDPADCGEDQAAGRVAAAVAGAGVRVAAPFTGRCNLYATTAGLLNLDATRITALNRLNESITLATLPTFERVAAGQMVATVKIITFAVAEETVARAAALAAGALRVAPFQPRSAALILTELPSTKPSVLDKRTEIMARRLASLGSRLDHIVRVPHEPSAVATAIGTAVASNCDPVLIFSASAIVDRGDVVPAGLIGAGGTTVHLGMPVDPGNLLLVGRCGAADVIGVPSCAGSPKLNGFDWVLERRIAGLPVGRDQLAAMGVGGLLKEIASRPQPRDGDGRSAEARHAPRLAAVVLAAGGSRRMGGRHKLLATVDGVPMVRHAVRAAIDADLDPVVVVTGHRADEVAEAVAAPGVTTVNNPDWTAGLATSLATGLAALPADIDGTFVLLGDMPRVTADHLARLAAAFSPADGRAAVIPTHAGQRGNPVIVGCEFFTAMAALSGDAGARRLLAAHPNRVIEVDLGTPAVLVDVDTPDDLARLDEKVAGP